MAPTVGEQLKAAREQRHLSLEAVANNTHIRQQFLKALEENRLEELSSKAQARGFIRLYASFLGIPTEPLLAAMEEKPPIEPSPVSEAPERPSSAVQAEETPEQFPAESSFTDEEETAAEQDYQIIYREIGQQLRQRREALSLSLDDISLHTRLKKNVLMTLEDGEFDSLPSPVQARGLLNNYAKFLNLDVDALLLRFAEALQLKRVIRPQPVAPPKRRAPTPETAEPAAAADAPTILVAIQKRTSGWLAALLEKLQPFTAKIKAAFGRIRPTDEKATPIPFPVKPVDHEPKSLARGPKLLAREPKTLAQEPEPLVAKFKLPTSWRRLITPDLITGAFLILLLFGFLFWAVTQLINWQVSQSIATPSSMANILLETQTITSAPELTGSPAATSVSTQTAASDGLTVNATLAATLPAGPTLPVQIAIIANQRAFVDVKTDGNDKFTGRVLPGNAYEFGAYNSIELTTGNAAALQVIYNQQNVGVLGSFGQDMILIFTPKGMATPTPAATPTATRTPTPTATVSATPTLQPSPTAPTPTVTPYVP